MAEELDRELCLALDIGGTKLAVGLVDRGGSLLFADRTVTPKATEESALFRVVADLVDLGLGAARAHGRVVGVGVGCGGPMRGDRVSPLNIPSWREFPLRARLSQLPSLAGERVPVAIDNDAKALALAEGWKGRARGERNFLAMVVSTGIGGGLVVDGRLLDGAHGNAGHVGHVIVEPGGRECGCGALGCLEAEASGTAIEALTGAPAADATPELRRRVGRLVGRAVASVANLLDIGRVFAGGSVALGFGDEFFRSAQSEIDERCRLEFSRRTTIEPVGLGPSAPLVGAAAVGWRALGESVLG